MVIFEKNVIKGIIGGIKSYIPSVNRYSGTGGTDDSGYCYAVWLRHLYVLSQVQSIDTNSFKSILEIGPGESMGVCLSAMMSGAESAAAVDIFDHIDRQKNFEIGQKVISFFKNKKPIPANQDFPFLSPKIPENVKLADLPIDWGQVDEKIDKVQNYLELFTNHKKSPLQFLAGDWMKNFRPDSCPDLVIAQGVFQYIDVLTAFQKISSWLRPGGIISLQVDYSSMGITKDWNGHWALGQATWRIMEGKRPFFANRLTHSEIKTAALIHGLEVLAEQKEEVGTRLEQSNWQIQNSRYKNIPPEDFFVSRCHFVLRKI